MSITHNLPAWNHKTKANAKILSGEYEVQGEGNDIGGGGLDWLAQVASGDKTPKATYSAETTTNPADESLAAALSGKPIPADGIADPVTVDSDHAIPADSGGDGPDWLSAAASSCSQEREVKPQAPVAEARTGKPSGGAVRKSPGGPGGWLSAADIGNILPKKGNNKPGSVSTSDGSKPNGAVASGASTPGGWLAAAAVSGRLGAPASNENLDSDAIAEGGSKAKVVVRSGMVETGTQTDEVTVTALRQTLIVEKPKTKLPPWAKPWTPPPVAAADPAESPGSPSDRKLSALVGDSNKEETLTGVGELDWIKATISGPSDLSKSEQQQTLLHTKLLTIRR